jgi:hypothetical protein
VFIDRILTFIDQVLVQRPEREESREIGGYAKTNHHPTSKTEELEVHFSKIRTQNILLRSGKIGCTFEFRGYGRFIRNRRLVVGGWWLVVGGWWKI